MDFNMSILFYTILYILQTSFTLCNHHKYIKFSRIADCLLFLENGLLLIHRKCLYQVTLNKSKAVDEPIITWSGADWESSLLRR